MTLVQQLQAIGTALADILTKSTAVMQALTDLKTFLGTV